MATTSRAAWRDLGERFKSIGDDQVLAHWRGDRQDLSERWTVFDSTGKFESLAALALELLGQPTNQAAARWLELLIDPEHPPEDGRVAVLRFVERLSENRCLELEVKAAPMTSGHQSSKPQHAALLVRARWLSEQMKKHNYTTQRLADLSGTDPRTVKRILNQEAVGRAALERIAHSLQSSPADIPNN